MQWPERILTKSMTKVLLKMTSNLKFFKEIIRNDKLEKTDLHFQISTNLMYQNCKKGETIFHINTRPTRFYIILKGEVIVFLDKTKKQMRRDERA